MRTVTVNDCTLAGSLTMQKHFTTLFFMALLLLAGCSGNAPHCPAIPYERMTLECRSVADRNEAARIKAQQDAANRQRWADFSMTVISWAFVVVVIAVFMGLYSLFRWFKRYMDSGHGERVQVLRITEKTKRHEMTQVARAPVASAPHSVTYAPRYSWSTSNRGTTNQKPTARDDVIDVAYNAGALEQSTIAIPDGFATLTHPEFVIGYDKKTGEPITMNLALELGHFSISGQGGFGKTVTAKNILSQHALAGGLIGLIDGHVNAEGGLASSLQAIPSHHFLIDPVGIHGAESAIAFYQDALYRRRDQQQEGQSGFAPVIIAVDEFQAFEDYPKLMSQLRELLKAVARQGRKLNMRLMVISHDWHVHSVGEWRSALNGHIIHRVLPEVMKRQVGNYMANLPRDTLELGRGECYVIDTLGKQMRVVVPNVTDDDIARAFNAVSVLDKLPTVQQGLSEVMLTVDDLKKPVKNSGYKVDLRSYKGRSQVESGVSRTGNSLNAQQLMLAQQFFVDKRSRSSIALEQSGGSYNGVYHKTIDDIEAIARQCSSYAFTGDTMPRNTDMLERCMLECLTDFYIGMSMKHIAQRETSQTSGANFNNFTHTLEDAIRRYPASMLEVEIRRAYHE